MTIQDRILEYLQKGKTITAYEAMKEFFYIKIICIYL